MKKDIFKMKNEKRQANNFTLMLAIFGCYLLSFTLFGCQDLFVPPGMDNNGEETIVHIYISDSGSSARTIQPAREAIAGYQLTFSGPRTRTPVNITTGNNAEIALSNGTWIITATAYKLGGTIGNSNDAIASGAITIDIAGGVVSGTIPPIYLSPSEGTGSGILNFNITFGSGISGSIKLFALDSITPINTFGTDGVMSLSNSFLWNFTLAAGRYVGEIRLENQEGKIAYSREVIEIWEGTTTAFVFTPVIFYDPDAMIAADYGDFNVINYMPSWVTYADGLLTITSNGTYIISMKNGVTSTTEDRIVVSPDVTADIILSGVNINRSGVSNSCAFDMTGANVNLTLIGDNTFRSGSGRAGLQAPSGSILIITTASTGTLTVTGGNSSAGIGGSSGDLNIGGNITIAGGTVTTTGSAAGIGGGWNGSGGTINISGGTVNATSNSWSESAGIGGSGSGAGGNVTITGGTITATGHSAGIGGGSSGTSGTITTINGNAVIFASSIQPALPTGSNLGPAIVFNGNSGIMYGNVSLTRNVVIPANRNLSIINGQTLSIQSGTTLTNNGVVLIETGGNVIGTVSGNQPVAPSFIISGNTAYTYSRGVLTITGNGLYEIGMRSGVTSTTAERIVVSSGVTAANIILTDVNINMSNNSSLSAFDMTGATVNLTIHGENILTGGINSAGFQVPSGANLTILAASTGSLIVNGGQNSAGIGGGSNSAGGTISIAGGTINATGGANWTNGAGIGGGSNGAGGNISITGGMVTATGLNSNFGIGGGSSSVASGSINTISGNAVIFASSIQPTLPIGGNMGSAIVFNGNIGTMYSNVTLVQNVTIPSGRILYISNGQTLTIPPNITLTNNGTIIKYDGGVIAGTVTGNQPVSPAFNITGNTGYTYAGGVLNITGNGTYSISMRTGVTSTTIESIVVSSGVTANITLSGVNIDRSNTSGACAFDMTGANVTLTLTEENILRSARAGLLAPEGSTLVISAVSTGSLTANTSTSWSGAAGIGGDNFTTASRTSGNITIAGGNITATGSSGGAGIGGGSSGAGGIITITGGTIIANNNSTSSGSAAIGGGSGGAGGTINISGGTITATAASSGSGAAIGGGSSGAGGTINITGGTITATGGTRGIGGGSSGTSGIINTINGNAVIFATSIQPALPTSTNMGPAIIFIGNNGTMYGNVTLIARDVTIPASRILPINAGQILTIQSGATLTNNGTMIRLDGGSVIGTVSGNQPIVQSSLLLTANTWIDGNIPSSDGEQWFRFTAIATTQWIHVIFGTLTSLNVQLYDNNLVAISSATLSGSWRSNSWSLTNEQVYYIRVRPGSTNSGTYQITFNTTSTAP